MWAYFLCQLPPLLFLTSIVFLLEFVVVRAQFPWFISHSKSMHVCAYMYVHTLPLLAHAHSVHVWMYPIDPVPIVTTISRVCMCCVESSVRGARRRKKRASAAKYICSVAQVKPINSDDVTCFVFTWYAYEMQHCINKGMKERWEQSEWARDMIQKVTYWCTWLRSGKVTEVSREGKRLSPANRLKQEGKSILNIRNSRNSC